MQMKFSWWKVISALELLSKLWRSRQFRNYFYNWQLKLNTPKTVCSVFHLTNCLADYELSITSMGERIPFDKTPEHLVVTLDHTLSYHQHLLKTAAKINKRCNLLKRLARNHWGADFTTLRTSTLALYFSVAKYCCSIWSQSYHCKKVDTSLNEYIKSSFTELLPILSGIEPIYTRRNKNILSFHISPSCNISTYKW